METLAEDPCTLCGEGKTPKTARLEARRIGLDELPDFVFCKCKDPVQLGKDVDSSIHEAMMAIEADMSTLMDARVKLNLNPVEIVSYDLVATKEIEIRMNPHLSQTAFMMMDDDVFENTSRTEITEVGCTMKVGLSQYTNAKVRQRSNGESVIKVSRSNMQIAPGYTFAMSDEFNFTGRIRFPQYTVTMIEIRCTIIVEGENVSLISRKYEDVDRITYSCEAEMNPRTTNGMIRATLSMLMGTFGTVPRMVRHVSADHLGGARSRDYPVVDVSSTSGVSGTIMIKADGMKVYIFCYSFGYIVCSTDPSLTVVSLGVIVDVMPIVEISDTPAIMMAEMMMGGEMVYIDVLSAGVDRHLSQGEKDEVLKMNIEFRRPMMTFRKVLDKLPSRAEMTADLIQNDGVVIVTKSRTVRVKSPTVDLLCEGGYLFASDDGELIPIASACAEMAEVIYEFDVIEDPATHQITLRSPRPRLMKSVPNPIDIVRRAIVSMTADVSQGTTLIDITSMSFSMRARVYEMARASAPATRKVIIIFGAGRFQEWREMAKGNFSFIAVDPMLDTSLLIGRGKKFTIVEYDPKQSISNQIMAIARRPNTVLCVRMRSEVFASTPSFMRSMTSHRIPAVFPFSVSYHIMLINTLRSSGVSAFGCGYVHEGQIRDKFISMRRDKRKISVHSASMEMVETASASQPTVRSVFGKSEWIEPYLSMTSVAGLMTLEKSMPEVWERVDSTTEDIMSMAVIMSPFYTSGP